MNRKLSEIFELKKKPMNYTDELRDQNIESLTPEQAFDMLSDEQKDHFAFIASTAIHHGSKIRLHVFYHFISEHDELCAGGGLSQDTETVEFQNACCNLLAGNFSEEAQDEKNKGIQNTIVRVYLRNASKALVIIARSLYSPVKQIIVNHKYGNR